MLKDNEVAKLVTDLTVIAQNFHDHYRLRQLISQLVVPIFPPIKPKVDAVEVAINRFLSWTLPADFAPDCGINFTPVVHNDNVVMPTGTNLFTAAQAKEMFEHCLMGVSTDGATWEDATKLLNDTGVNVALSNYTHETTESNAISLVLAVLHAQKPF